MLSGLLFLVLMFVSGFIGPIYAGDIPLSAWPKSWFETPKTASELEINSFNQSPILDDDVLNGKLPPVIDRLPDDPIVVEGINGIGKYGGTAQLFYAGEQLLNVQEGPLRPGPTLKLTLPNFARRVEYSNGSKTLTIYLREGHRWSDGHLITSSDFEFWFNHVYDAAR